MTIREKLLLKLAQDPSFEGGDETEKSLVAELKAEMGNAKNDSDNVDVKAAAKELITGMTELMKSMQAANAAAAPADRNAIVADQDALTPEKVKAMSKENRFAEYAKALYHKDFARTKALAEGVDADGGYLVPEGFRAELIEHLNKPDTIRSYATVIPMTSNLLKVPKLTTDVSVTWGTENKSISTTTADFGELQLTPHRLNAIIYTSREVFEDSAISIMEILRRRFADRVAVEENKVFIVGNGSGKPKGIDAETLRTVSAGSALSPDHITKAYYKLPKEFRGNARWLINSRVMEYLENKKEAGTGAYIYPSLQGEVKTLKGRPVLIDDNVASSKIFFGDLSQYFIGDRQQMSMETTTEAGNTWAKHQVGLKLIERVDGKVAQTIAFVEITTTGIS